MKNKLPETEQLAALTARLVAAGIVPRLGDSIQMFRASLDYWRRCEDFLQYREELESRVAAAGPEGLADAAESNEGVPKPTKFPVTFHWLLNNLFDGDRGKLREYIEYCQSCGAWPPGDADSFVAPILDGTDVEGFHYLTRHWPQWRQVRINATLRRVATKRPARKPAARKAAKKKARAAK